jgi:hypothetical protein
MVTGRFFQEKSTFVGFIPRRAQERGGDGSSSESLVNCKVNSSLDRRDAPGTSRPHPFLWGAPV